MIKYCCLGFLLFLFGTTNVKCQQNYTIDSNHILFEDAVTGEPVLKYNDSMLIRGFNLDTHTKTNFPLNLKTNAFSNYNYIIKNKNYFVSNGGGQVLEFKENNFVRIDNSFRHKNQFLANHFTYNNTLYLWGGYGLFTHKNILTYYNFNAQEWLLKEIKIPEDLEPRLNAFHIIDKDKLYIIGGKFRSTNKLKPNTNVDNVVWQLDLKTFEWSKGKKFNSFDVRIQFEKNYIQVDQKLIIIGTNIQEIDLFENTIKTYTNNNYKGIKNIIYHKKNKFITFTHLEDGEIKIVSTPLDQIIGELIKTEPFYKEMFPENIFNLIIIFSVVGLFVFLLSRYKTDKNKLKKQIIYKTKENLFSTTNNAPIKLSKMPFDILKLFLENQDQYIPFSVLNEVINKGVGEQNYITLNKRRERVFSELVTELSNKLKIDKKNIIKTRKNEIDKRIKEVTLNIEFVAK